MNKTQYRLATVLMITWLPALAQAADSVQAWLEKMQHAAHMVNYDGTFVYTQQDQLSAMRLIHSVGQKGERERLVSLDSTGREVIRDDKRVTCILPDQKSVVVEKGRPKTQFPPTFPTTLDKLKQNYHFSLGRREQVAGQMTQKIIIAPRDQHRYGHRLWVDARTGLLLQKYLLDEKQRPLERFMFTSIEYLDKVPEALLKSQSTGKEYTWYESDEMVKHPVVKKRQWRVDWLPKGFMPDMSRQHRLPRSKMPLEHLVFSDGLASISVFIESHNDHDDRILGGSKMGAINAFGRHMDGFHITTVGEVPQNTVRRVSESVRMKD